MKSTWSCVRFYSEQSNDLVNPFSWQINKFTYLILFLQIASYSIIIKIQFRN